MRVLIVPDKFKGTLTAQEAAEAIEAGWKKARPSDELELLPMSDGGDGFGEILAGTLPARRQKTATVNAAHEMIDASWWWVERDRTAIIESARVNGLAMLPPGKFHPFDLDTLGLGRLIRELLALHPEAELVIGIGGSATNDGGFGLALGLGFRFLRASGAEIRRWTELVELDRIEKPEGCPAPAAVTIATDVQNPLLGPRGATRIYGPQKGLKPEDFPHAEACLARLAEIVRRDLKVDAMNEPGTGAAGGLGFGLRVFLNGRFEAGFEIFARFSRIEERIQRADLVVTGEGSIDAQTQMGKGTGAVAQLVKSRGKPCLGLAGVAPERGGLFTAVHAICPDRAPREEAIAQAGPHLRALSFEVASRLEPVPGSTVTFAQRKAPPVDS